MVDKHCAYGVCSSDSRYAHRPDMQGVKFLYFPQPRKELEKCKRLVKLCGRPTEGKRKFTVDSVTKDSYICTKHFVGGQGPTAAHPDPIPATASSIERELFIKHKKRQAPKKRSLALPAHQQLMKKARTDLPDRLLFSERSPKKENSSERCWATDSNLAAVCFDERARPPEADYGYYGIGNPDKRDRYMLGHKFQPPPPRIGFPVPDS